MSARETFAKVAAGLDSNRKIRKAGRDGRDVFLWVLRQCALRDSDGSIPAEDVTDFEFVAEQLMCSVDQAKDGLSRACAAKLLEVVDGECCVVGWDTEWGRRPLSNTERQRRFRGKRNDSASDGDCAPSDVTTAPLRVTDNVTSNAGEERRGEEKRERAPLRQPASPVAPPSDSFRLEPDQAPAPRAPRPPKARRSALPDSWEPKPELRELAASLGVNLEAEVAKLRDWARAEGQAKSDWDATARNWVRRAGERRQPPRAGPFSPPFPQPAQDPYDTRRRIT